MMAAKATSVAELELDEGEAKMMSDAVAEVASHYSVVVDPKIIAWVGLVGVCGSIYGPRVAAYRMRKSYENAEKKSTEAAKPSANVVGIQSTDAPAGPVLHQFQAG